MDSANSSELSDSEDEKVIIDWSFCTEDSEISTDSDSHDDSARASEIQPDILVARPPEILEPCQLIAKISGIQSKHLGYRICGDNIDKTVRTRYMRSEYRNSSMHYFHSYAVQNPIDFSHLSDTIPSNNFPDPEDIASSVLPSASDDKSLNANIAILVSRVLVTHLKYFNVTFQDVTQRHIQHQFYQEMSQKSVVVSWKKVMFRQTLTMK